MGKVINYKWVQVWNAREQALFPPPPIMHATYLVPWWPLCKTHGPALTLSNLWNTPTSSWKSIANRPEENPLGFLSATPPWLGGGGWCVCVWGGAFPFALPLLTGKAEAKEKKYT